MIHEILKTETCAKCKGCCVFDEHDKWEAPAALLPPTVESNGLLLCVHLTESGCELGDNKPLECALYPFRIMQLYSHKVIALSSFCKAVTDLPLSEIIQFVENNYKTFLSTGITKEYSKEYIILKVVET